MVNGGGRRSVVVASGGRRYVLVAFSANGGCLWRWQEARGKDSGDNTVCEYICMHHMFVSE